MGAVLGGVVGIVPAVFQEAVVAGLRGGHPDAERIAEAIGSEPLDVLGLVASEVRHAGRLLADPGLGPGECETIACAHARGVFAVLNDRKARQVAASQGVRTLKSVDILLLGLMRRRLALAAFKHELRRLSQITGIDAATLFEYELLADEIAGLLGQREGAEPNG